MQKNELLKIHTMLDEIHTELEKREGGNFVEPEVEPDDIICSKSEHRKAIFELGENISNMLKKDGEEFTDIGRLEKRMKEKKKEVLV